MKKMTKKAEQLGINFQVLEESDVVGGERKVRSLLGLPRKLDEGIKILFSANNNFRIIFKL